MYGHNVIIALCTVENRHKSIFIVCITGIEKVNPGKLKILL